MKSLIILRGIPVCPSNHPFSSHGRHAVHRIMLTFVSGTALASSLAYAQTTLIDLGLPSGVPDCEASSICSDGTIVDGSYMLGLGRSAFR